MGSLSVSDRLREPSERLPRPDRFRILSIDGGGIRGVIPAVFLDRLEELLKAELDNARAQQSKTEITAPWEGVTEPRIADCFHLIAGTSTGGLLAAGLTVTAEDGRPKLSAADTVNLYEVHGARIFRRPLWRNVLDHWNVLFPRYPLTQLKEVLQDPSLLGEGLLKNARTDALITSYDTKGPGPRFFTRWGASGAGTAPATPPETMVQVALATAAAPTYFDPERLNASELVDGGVFAGNPALAAISMALRRTDDPAPLNLGDLLMISLGTGAWEQPLDYGWGGILGWLRPRTGGEALLEALLGSQGDFATEAAHMMLNGWSAASLPGARSTAAGERGPTWWDPNVPPAGLGGGPQFWRYQATLPEPWSMDDVSKLTELKQVGTQMTQHYEAELKHLAETLIQAGPVPA